MSRTRFARAQLQLQAVALAASAVFVSGAVASSSASMAQAGSTVFNDASGDAQGGPDVTRVAVSGNAATGSVALTVTAAGYIPTSTDALERDVVVWMDTDLNRATGDPEDGTEYALQAWNDPSGRWWNLSRWTGSDWESAPDSSSMSFTRQGDELSWTMGTSDIGGATRFRFYVLAGTWNAATDAYDARDEAPNEGFWSFDISAPTPAPQPPATKTSLVVGAPQAAPPVRRCGQAPLGAVSGSDTEGRADDRHRPPGETRSSTTITWEHATSGRATCSTSVGGRVLPARCALRGDFARITFVIPKTAKGKRLTISMKITAKDADTGKTLTATRVATYAVK